MESYFIFLNLVGFEQSPFKLTHEFVEVMDGTSTELWAEFNHLLLKGLMAARKHMDRIINLVEIMRSSEYFCPFFCVFEEISIYCCLRDEEDQSSLTKLMSEGSRASAVFALVIRSLGEGVFLEKNPFQRYWTLSVSSNIDLIINKLILNRSLFVNDYLTSSFFRRRPITLL